MISDSYFDDFIIVYQLANGEGKHLSMVEMSKLIGAKWKALSTEDRLAYEEAAQADRDR